MALYYGETPQDQRQDIVESFQDKDSPLRFFVGQPKTGGYGITLTEATTVIYFSNSYDLEIRLQSEDRAHRIGQHHPVTYIDLVSPKTIDEKILKALRSKINLAEKVLGEDARQNFFSSSFKLFKRARRQFCPVLLVLFLFIFDFEAACLNQIQLALFETPFKSSKLYILFHHFCQKILDHLCKNPRFKKFFKSS